MASFDTRIVARQKAAPGVGLLDVAVVFVSYIAIQFGVGIVLGIFLVLKGYGPEEFAQALEGGTALVVTLFAAAAPVIGACLVALYRRAGASLFGLGRVSRRWLLIGVGAGLSGWLLNVGMSLLYQLATGDTSDPQQSMKDAAMSDTSAQFALLMLAGGLLVPFGEELLFRGVLFAWLRRWGLILAVAVSALVFAAFHGFNELMLSTAALGVLFALLYEKSGSLGRPSSRTPSITPSSSGSSGCCSNEVLPQQALDAPAAQRGVEDLDRMAGGHPAAHLLHA